MTFKWIGKSTDGKTVVLNRLEESRFQFPSYFTPEWEKQNAESVRIGAVVDVETTGLSHHRDQVIEIGIRQFKFNRATGEILSLTSSYSALQDPGEPLDEEIVTLTGITDEMLKGQKINWDEVGSLLKSAQIVVAHNASFDRPFLDQSAPVSAEKVWACSLRQVDWTKKGFSSSKLDLLNVYHGFFTDSHRALNDADALLYLLSFKDADTGSPYFLEILNNARKTTVHVVASASPFESKDHLKNRNYRWDVQAKSWSKVIGKEELAAEIIWLETYVYSGTFRGKHTEILPVDQFKASKS